MKLLSGFAVVSIVTSSALFGCSEDKSQGLCDQNYLDTYNDVIASKMVVEAYYHENGTKKLEGENDARSARAALQTLDTTCESFLSRYRGASCKAMALDNGEAVQTSSVSIENTCSVTKSLLASDATPESPELYNKTEANAELHALPKTQANVEVLTAAEVEQQN